MNDELVEWILAHSEKVEAITRITPGYLAGYLETNRVQEQLSYRTLILSDLSQYIEFAYLEPGEKLCQLDGLISLVKEEYWKDIKSIKESNRGSLKPLELINAHKHSEYKFDVKKITQYLRPYCSRLDQLYNWETPNYTQLKRAEELSLISSGDFKILGDTNNYFERNVLLKNIICKNISMDSSRTQIYYEWIIKDWGGIGGFRNSELNNLIHGYLVELESNGIMQFDSIASISKALSFTYPEKYIIYDARVAYSLNWIILKTQASGHFFPMPTSRNSKLTAFDVATLVRLSNLKLFQDFESSEEEKRFISKRDTKLFVTDKKAYQVMCDLIYDINLELWGAEKKDTPYYTEMLLFSLADRDIFKDIVMSMGVKFHTS